MVQSTQQLSPEKFPVGQRVNLPGHFLEPVTLEGIRFIGSGYECRVRLADGTLNPWQRATQVIASLDYAKQEDVRERVWQQRWDLVIVDEAHKCSAYTKRSSGRGDEVEKTRR